MRQPSRGSARSRLGRACHSAESNLGDARASGPYCHKLAGPTQGLESIFGKRFMRRIRPFIAPLLLGVAAWAIAGPERPVSIRAEIIQERISYLASDELAGRGSGTP